MPLQRPRPSVSGTRIYAAAHDDGTQRIAYAMTVALPSDVAMVLPIPTPPRAAASTLVAHDVGDFEASFVPTLADFVRLDARFRMPDDVWSKLPAYEDWGFAVFKLRAPVPRRGVLDFLRPEPPRPPRRQHPMAFDFPRRDAGELFFPTVHVHDGEVHPVAHFDHSLYAQLDRPSARTPSGWEGAARPTATLREAARRFAHADRHVFRRRLRGMQPNGDQRLSSRGLR